MGPSYSIHSIDTSETDFHNSVVQAYLNGSLNDVFTQNKSIDEVAEDISSGFSTQRRDELTDEILRQYHTSQIHLSDADVVRQNIELLRKSNTFTVTTGQQVHVMLGPLFMANKILSVCAEAKRLNTEHPNKNFVPVFWLASEDHDFEEINTVKLYNEVYTWETAHGGAVGRLNPNSLVPLVQAARARADKTDINQRFFDLCEKAYALPISFAEATRYILHHWFEETGIIILDADSHALKNHLVDNIEQDLFQHSNASQIDKTITLLKKNGIKAPINTRPINYFLFGEGERSRIERKGDGFELIPSGKKISEEEVRALLKNAPEQFSPNALLRPVYQQLILPNVTYICGGGEFQYWLELKAVTEHANAAFPALAIRPSIFYTRASTIDFFHDNSLELSWIFLIREKQDQCLFEKTSKEEVMWSNTQADVREALEKLKNLISDKTPQFEKRISKLQASYEQLEQDVHQAVSASHTNENPVAKKFQKLSSKLWSEGFVYERHVDIIQSLAEIEVAKTCFTDNYEVYLPGRLLTLIGIS